jgi:hypothetical protein
MLSLEISNMTSGIFFLMTAKKTLRTMLRKEAKSIPLLCLPVSMNLLTWNASFMNQWIILSRLDIVQLVLPTIKQNLTHVLFPNP